MKIVKALKIIASYSIATLFIVHTSTSQSKLEIAQDLKSRTLIVLLKSEDSEIIKKLENKTELEYYRTSIKKLNSDLSWVIENFWDFNDEVLYKTSAEITILKEGNDKDYAILYLNLLGIRDMNNLTFKSSNYVLSFNVDFLEDINPKHPMYYQAITAVTTNLKVPAPLKRDLIFATQMVQNHLAGAYVGIRNQGQEIKDNLGLLEYRTLLLDTLFIDPKMTSGLIDESYPYEFKISNHKEIEDALLNRDERYAYVILYPIISSNPVYQHWVIDCKNGTLISASYSGSLGHMNQLIDAQHLNNYVKYSTKKKKKRKR